MQCTSYNLGYYYLRDLRGRMVQIGNDNENGLNGRSWPTGSSNIVWTNGQSFNVLLPQPSTVHDLGPQKEICRQMMLKHESTFKYQVHELHRLYRRQKELMEENRNRDRLERSFKLPFVSETERSEISMESHWSSRNATGNEPSLPLFQKDSSFIAGDGEQLATERQHSTSQRTRSGKRMLDLELPGDMYIDLEDENDVRTPNTPIINLQPVHESKLDSLGSSVSDSSCRKTTILFDLNEPALPDESDFPGSSSLLESDTSQHDIADLNRDLPEKEKSNADCSYPNEETLPNTTVKEGTDRDSCKTSPLSEKDEETGPLPCNSQAGDESNLSCFAEDSSSPGIKRKRRTSDSNLSEKNNDEAVIDVPTSLSSQRNSIRFVVQALPCVNNKSLNKCFKSSVSKRRLSGKKLNVKKIKHLKCDADEVINTTVPNASAKHSKISDSIDVPPNNLSDDDDSSGLTSVISHSNPPEAEHKENDDDHVAKISTRINSAERDLKAPVSPENQECSPPRSDSHETHLERLKEGEDQEEANCRLAADTLVLILSLSKVKYPQTAIGCLDWFADVAMHLKMTKSELEPKKQTCSGNRKARSGNRKGARCSKNSHLQQQTCDKKPSSAEMCLKVWGSKKKRMGRIRSVRVAPVSAQVVAVSS